MCARANVRNKIRAGDMPALLTSQLLAFAVAVARHELVDAAGGVHQLRLTGIERVRSVGDLQLDEGIGFALHLDGVLRSGRRTAEELSTIRHIFENYYAVVIRMNSLFHFTMLFKPN